MTTKFTVSIASALIAISSMAMADQPDIEVHRQSISGSGSVNTYLIETQSSLIVLDTQRQISANAQALSQIEDIGKPVTHIIISHAHPDHFGGINAFKAAFPDAIVVMDAITAQTIADDVNGFSQMGTDFFGDDFSARPQADMVLKDSDELVVDGVTFVSDVKVDTEASSIMMIAVPEAQILFSSDLVAHEMHPFLVDADIANWGATLRSLRREYTGYMVYPGHGASDDAGALFASQESYINDVTSIVVANAGTDRVLSADEKTRSAAEISAQYPGWTDVTGRADILQLNVEAIAAQALDGE